MTRGGGPTFVHPTNVEERGDRGQAGHPPPPHDVPTKIKRIALSKVLR
jgi:hypothetical protein